MAKVAPRFKQGKGGANAKTGAAGEEAIVCELKGVDVTPENAAIQLDVNCPVTTSGTSTEVIVRIRRVGLTGTEVAKVQLKPGASAITGIPLQANDEPGESANLTYVVTLQDVAGKQSEANGCTIQATY